MNHKMNYLYHFSLIICGAWIFLTSLPRDVSSQSHNFECSSSSSCDSSKHLECDSFKNTCDCPKTMEWSEKLHRCVMKEGQKCEIGNSNESPCTQHSSCISGFCECDVNYLRNGFGSCFLGYDLPCNNSHSSSEGQCALRYGLDCVEDDVGGGLGRCRCRGESVDFVWDEYRQKCVSLVGTTCDGEADRRDDKLECVQNADCINRICTCKPEFSPTPDRKCLKSYGQKCDNSEGDFCNRYALLNCGDGKKCGCEFYGQMDYDEKVGECRMLVGEICEMLKPGGNLTDGHVLHKCVEDAVCVVNPKSKHTSSSHANSILKGKCSCEGGKIKTGDGKCTNLRRHNMSCSFAGDCDKSLFLTCFIDEERGGLCSCPPGEMFFDGSTCLSLPGKRCSEGKRCGRNSTCIDGQFCHCNEDYTLDLEHMTCRPRKSATITTSTSTTTTSTSTTTLSPVRKEVPGGDWETRSGGSNVYSVGGDAPVVVGLGGCTGMDEKSLEFQRCSCEVIHSGVKVWSEEKASCLALVGAACEFDEHCIELAYCEMEDRVCQCLVEEARSTLNNTCVLRKRKTHSEPVIKDENGGYVNDRIRNVPDEGDHKHHQKHSGSSSNEAAQLSTVKYLTSLTVIPFIFNVILMV